MKGLQNLRSAGAATCVAAALACAASEPANIGFVDFGAIDTSVLRYLQAMLDSVAAPRAAILSSIRPVGAASRQPSSDLGDPTARALGFLQRGRFSAVIGPSNSSEALLVAPLFNEASVPQIVPTATNRSLRSVGPWTFMLAPTDSLEGDFIADFAANHLRARRATVFWVSDPYGLGLSDPILRGLEARGVSVLSALPIRLDGLCPPRGANAYRNVVPAALLRGIPDVVIVAGRSPETACIAALLSELTPGVPLIGADGVDPGPRHRFDYPAATPFFHVTFWHPGRNDPMSRQFVRSFEEAIGRTPHHGDALTFDAVLLLAHAIRSVGDRPGRVRDWLAAAGSSRPPIDGVTGPLASGHSTRRALVMMELVNGICRPVERSPQ